MCASIDSQEVLFCDLLSCFALVLISFFCPGYFENSEDSNIETLVDVGHMGSVASNVNVMSSGILQESKCVVGVMSVYEKQLVMFICLFPCLLIKNLDPFNPDFAICPPFF